MISKKLTPRIATLADLAAIVAIYNSTVASRQVTADLHPVSVADREAWFHAHNENSRPLWVAVNENDEVCGWLSLSDYYARAAYHISTEISIYIHPDERKSGLGQFLLDHAINWGKANGIHNITAIIFAHNEPSCRFFLKNGFTQWGLLPKFCLLDTQLADVIIFGLSLVSCSLTESQ